MKRLSVYLILFRLQALVALVDNCGRTKHELGLIKCDFPWLSSIHHSETNIFLCNSHIISERHVITSGNCLIENLQEHVHAAVLVYIVVGRISLSEKPKTNQIYKVRQIRLSEIRNFEALIVYQELAILTLSRSIIFSKSVHPICIKRDIKCEEKCSVTRVSFEDCFEVDYILLFQRLAGIRVETLL